MPTYIIYYNQGNTPGPFDIYLSGSSGLNLYASNIAQWQLENGYQVTFPDGIPSSSIEVFDTSYGCFVEQNVPFPTPSPTVTPTISVTPSKTPTISVTPSITKTPSVTPTATPSFTPPPSLTPTLTVTPSISVSPGPPSPTRTPTITRTPSATLPPVYGSYGITAPGVGAAYQACYEFNTNGFNGGWIWFLEPAGPGLGAVAYENTGTGYTPFNGGNQWYAIGAWYLGIATAYQINSLGVIVDVQYYSCLIF
jgi:hypothetical protein